METLKKKHRKFSMLLFLALFMIIMATGVATALDFGKIGTGILVGPSFAFFMYCAIKVEDTKKEMFTIEHPNWRRFEFVGSDEKRYRRYLHMWEIVLFIPILILIVMLSLAYFGLIDDVYSQIALVVSVWLGTAGIFRLHECLEEYHDHIHDDDSRRP